MIPYQPIGIFGYLLRFLILFCIGIAGCGPSADEAIPRDIASTAQRVSVACGVTNVRYPTNLSDFGKLYNNRGFYTDGNHLGRDIALAEGTAVYPISCGSVRVYRPATKYGLLAVVVEHQLPKAITVVNGLGANVSITSFLTIYAHLRKSPDAAGGNSLAFKTDDTVSVDAPIGYVDGAATNGDGGVHLHFGVRLQSMSDAISTDANWFRGYDDSFTSQRRWFADPSLFMDALLKAEINVRWHPPGTVIERQRDKSHWLIKSDGAIFSLSPDVEARDRLSGRAISVSDAEFGCLGKASGGAASELAGHRLVKFDDASAVYEYNGIASGSKRWTFLSTASFLSWNWTFAEVETWGAVLRPSFFGSATDQGYRTLRDGSLVKAKGSSEVAVVSGGQRLPLYDWSTFLALGYKAEQIIELDESVMDISAGPRGAVITPDLAALCHHSETCLANCPVQGPGGGGIENAGGSGGAGGTLNQAGGPAGGQTGVGGASGFGGTSVPSMDAAVTGGAGGSTIGTGGSSGAAPAEVKADAGPARRCLSGEVRVCACVGLGTVGVQSCAPDGMSLLMCECPLNPAVGGGGSSGAGGATAPPPSLGSGGTTRVCLANESILCACLGLGMVGVQTCASDGMSLLACECPVTASGGAFGSGGSTGTAGSGGSASSGGSSNLGGATPTGGSSGSPVSPAVGGGGSAPPPVIIAKPLHLYYSGPLAGPTTISGWWMIPGVGPVSWHVITECVDANTADAILDCDLPVPSGASPFEFQVNLPGTKYWGDEACDSGGCGTTLGTVTLTKGGNPVSYTLTPNSAGPPYYNGRVAPVP